MYLKEIVISGFKSFADRTRLDLRRGMTAVVGPNGCGKSNIVDAIRWVLGEQSAKALRGSLMQDVIFEGTDKRKALPVCEVALTFTDCETELGTAFNEVEISRRVTREGGSDYYINGKISRLKDIQRLFANTGVGRVSYSFMLQGQIDQVLSTNPAERRTIFEEAAGITLYKAQRKEALNKLALVDTNLARVTDVIEEVSRQISSLKRQASKALRYQRINHRLSHLDLAYSAYRHSNLRESIEQICTSAEDLRQKLKTHIDSLESDELALTQQKSARGKLSEKMQDLQQRVYNLRSEKENADNQAEFADIRCGDLQGRIAEFKKEIDDLEEQKSSLAKRAEDEAENKQLQLGVVDDSDRIFQDRSKDLLKAQEGLGTMEAELQEVRQSVLLAENRINRARSRCTTLEVDLKTYQVKHASLTETIIELKDQGEILRNGLLEIQHAFEKRQAEQQRSQVALESAKQASQNVLVQFRNLQEAIQDQDRSIARKTAQLNVLEGLQAKFEGFGEGAKAILGDQLNDLVAKDNVVILSKELKVKKPFTKALEVLLGSAVEALFVGESDKALSVIDRLDRNALGRACLQIEINAAQSTPKAKLPDNLVPAISAVSAREDALNGPVRRLLSGCYFADSLEEFMEFWKVTPEFNFLFVATKDGEIIDCRGLIHGGRTSGKRASNVLAREADIRQLRAEIDMERKELNNRRKEASDLGDNRDSAESKVDAERQKLSELNSEISVLNSEQQAQKERIEQNSLQHQASDEQIKELEDHHGDSVRELEEAQKELKTSEIGLSDERQAVANLEEAIYQARETRDHKREAVADVRLELAERKQRLESLDRSLNEVERESESLQERILRRNQEIDTIHEQISKLKSSRVSESEKSVELKKTLSVATEQLEQDQVTLKAMDISISDIDAGLSQRRGTSRALDQELTKLDVRLAEERSQLGFIESAAQGNYQIELQAVDWKLELWEAGIEFDKQVNLDQVDDPDQFTAQAKQQQKDPTQDDLAEMDLTDWSQVEGEVQELKGRITSMGPVNLDAIGEYADLKERHDFLKKQSEDLWNSKNALVKTIDDINETSQSLFRETFEQVKKNFAFTYEKLSGGGFADLQLIDSEDPLESGIEIIARPPGTRLKSVSLLSGGQRTMTAVALLFAIYMVRPSPFCVLDEIDAALDDANIGRFCKTLEGFTSNSQFLIITHNKRTISNADTVFGVTMPEKGVSTLISMRFNKDSNSPDLVGLESR